MPSRRASSSSNGFYRHGNKITNGMLSNHFSFKVLYAAFKENPGGIGEENYKRHRTSRSQSAASPAGGMQGRAVRQETSVLCIAPVLDSVNDLGPLTAALLPRFHIRYNGARRRLWHMENVCGTRRLTD